MIRIAILSLQHASSLRKGKNKLYITLISLWKSAIICSNICCSSFDVRPFAACSKSFQPDILVVLCLVSASARARASNSADPRQHTKHHTKRKCQHVASSIFKSFVKFTSQPHHSQSELNRLIWIKWFITEINIIHAYCTTQHSLLDGTTYASCRKRSFKSLNMAYARDGGRERKLARFVFDAILMAWSCEFWWDRAKSTALTMYAVLTVWALDGVGHSFCQNNNWS